MPEINLYVYIIAGCLLVISSYLFNVISKMTGLPSVLLLLLAGIGVREIFITYNNTVPIPPKLVELLGVLGLIMIVLEAGLDLNVSRKKIKLIRNAFLSALFILAFSAAACSLMLFYYLQENYLHCLIYAIPLSIVSSAIVIPSIEHITEHKKDFLVYETSFSDILGIIFFNYMIAGNLLKAGNMAFFVGTVIFSLVLSIIFSLLLLFMLTRIRTKVRLFLAFSLLVFLYSGGKLLHLPGLFIILVFGLIVSNWHISIFQRLYRWIAPPEVNEVTHLLHSLTAESSFLIRTFFFFIFGLTIDIRLLIDKEVLLAGASLVILLFLIRYIYLRFFLRSHIFPELFFMPRGLITILLFYSIPAQFRLLKFNEGILFFVILTTSIIMAIGSISYGRSRFENNDIEIPISENNV